ncbi:MAG: ABC transporter permease [Anaerolineales bacterium]
MLELLRSPIRALAFVRKEIFEVLRQPRLILTLVLGPFLILLLVGIGYRNEARVFRALFVVQDNPALAQRVREYATTLGPSLVYMGTVDNEAEAKARLRRGEADLVVVAPPDAYQRIRNSEQAIFTVFHNEIDPFQASYVQFVGQLYVEDVNRRVLQAITKSGQGEAASVQDDLAQAKTAATAMREALERGDSAGARQQQQTLNQRVSALELAVGATAGVLGNVQQTVGTGGSEVEMILASLDSVRQNTSALSAIADCGACTQEAQTAKKIEDDLGNLESLLSDFQNINPAVLVSPFRSDVKSIAPVALDVTDFFAPAVLALLLQHLAVIFAALSIVRERQLGTVELFRVSPLAPAEALLGKYLSYMLFGGVLAAILTALVIYALRVPMLGNWLYFSLVVTLLLFASLGIGFVISLVAQTDSQAVQYAMLVLLASVFFSGFLLALYLLWAPVRVVSWMLPMTYGMQLLQGIMLRGATPSPLLLGGLAIIGLVMFLVAWLLMRRLMARR